MSYQVMLMCPGFDIRCLNNWGPFSKLALASMLMCCVEWWAFELSVFLAGKSGQTCLVHSTDVC